MDVKPPTEYDKFTKLVTKVLSVPKAEIQRRQDEYQKQAELNPNRRGPKPKKAGKP